MSTPFESLADLDRLLHSPPRLAILTALAACERADFLFLQSLTGLSKGNLSSNLARLEGAELVEIEKRIVDKTTRTTARLTPKGRGATEEHWQALETLRERAQAWRPELQPVS